jgi:Neuralized
LHHPYHTTIKDGRSINENYGTDLDKLEEGDRVGVLRTGLGDLIFFVNGIAQGVAASGLPPRVYAVIDMYGKCAQVSLMTDNTLQEARIQTNDLANVATAAAAASTHLNSITSNNSHNNITNTNIQAATLAASAAVAAATSSGIAFASASG